MHLDLFHVRLGEEVRDQAHFWSISPLERSQQNCQIRGSWLKREDKEMDERGLAAKDQMPICMYVG